MNDIFISMYHLWLYFRLLWFILFGFAIWYGYLLYTPFLDVWNNEPTVIATDQADFPVEKLPFPAITICSNNKIVNRQLESVLRTRPWKGLTKLNYNITQETDNGRLNINLHSTPTTVSKTGGEGEKPFATCLFPLPSPTAQISHFWRDPRNSLWFLWRIFGARSI